MNTARTAVLWTLLVTSLVPQVSSAHEFWLQPKEFWWQPTQSMPVSLLVGHSDHSARSKIPARRITRFEVVGPGDEAQDLRNELRPGADTELRLDAPGAYVIVLATDNQARSDLPADRFNEYLRAEGLTPALTAREQTGQMQAEGSERYSRHAKSLVQVGPSQQQSQVTQAVGLRLEIVPEINPYAEPRSAQLPVRVMFEGKPLAGALVKMSNPTDASRGVISRISDDQGRAVFDMPSHGEWLMHVTWTKSLPSTDEADFDTVFASLTFGLTNAGRPFTASDTFGLSNAGRPFTASDTFGLPNAARPFTASDTFGLPNAVRPFTASDTFGAPNPARPFTASDLVTLRKIGAVTVSPDGRWVVWDQRETDLASNAVRSGLWLLDLEHPDQPRQLAAVGHDPRFGADGEWIYFLSDASGVNELWRVPTRKGAAQQVSDFDVPIVGYSLSPTAEEVAIWADVSTACNELPCTLPQPVVSCCGSGRGFDSAYVQRETTWREQQARSTIYVPHRDEWMMPEIRSRIFVMSVNGGNATSAMGRWLGDAQQVAWGADGKSLFFTLREARREERFVLDLDIIESRLGAATPTNLTASNPSVDALPATSPDGRWLAYVSAGKLQLRDLATGAVMPVAGDWNATVRSIAWAPDSVSLFVTARVGMDEPLFQIRLDGRKVTRLTGEGRISNVVPMAQGGAVVTHDTMLQPADLYRMSADGQLTRLTTINADRWRDIETPRVERFEFKGSKGVTVSAWMIAPETGRARLPTLLLIHDGMQAAAANSWSRHWNPLLYAAPGYSVIGVEFRSEGSRVERDRLALDDLRLGLAAAARRFPVVDPDNVCIAGDGAYGGYLAYRIAGEWSRPPRCLIANGGVVDAASMSYQTDEPWMHDWQQLSTSSRGSRGNPLQFVDAWRTPPLILHGESNFRVPYTQSLVAFTAAQRRNLASRLVVFPDEGVQVQTPKNTIQWYGEVFNWLDRWLSRGPGGTRVHGCAPPPQAASERQKSRLLPARTRVVAGCPIPSL